MINISTGRDLQQLSADFYITVKDEIDKRLKNHLTYLNGFSTKNGINFGDYLISKMESIITSELQETLDKISPEIDLIFATNYKVVKKVPTDFKKVIDDILFFEEHDKWNAYEFTKKLWLHCCPYCNRTYITTLGEDTKKFSRPDIDHFLPKSKYGYLRFSFYNLIPSCVICNRNAKGRKTTNLKTNIYPYQNGFEKNAKFTYQPANHSDIIGIGNSKINFKLSGSKTIQTKLKKNIDLFRLVEQYSIHSYELNHLIKLKKIHSEAYIENLMNNYKGLLKDEREAYELAFGKEYDLSHDDKRPLSKFTRDILYELDMLKKLKTK